MTATKCIQISVVSGIVPSAEHTYTRTHARTHTHTHVCIQLENRRRLVQLQESLMDHISATAYTRDLLQVLDCSSLHTEALRSN